MSARDRDRLILFGQWLGGRPAYAARRSQLLVGVVGSVIGGVVADALSSGHIVEQNIVRLDRGHHRVVVLIDRANASRR